MSEFLHYHLAHLISKSLCQELGEGIADTHKLCVSLSLRPSLFLVPQVSFDYPLCFPIKDSAGCIQNDFLSTTPID